MENKDLQDLFVAPVGTDVTVDIIDFEAVETQVKTHPAGIINVIESFMCIYHEAFVCLGYTDIPLGTEMLRHKGVGITHFLNQGVRHMLRGDYQWLWMVDDLCVYSGDTLTKLLDRDVDIIVPYCLSGDFPHLPELYTKDYELVSREWVAEQEGIVEADLLAPFWGMLIKREVCEALEDPWFANGKTVQERLGGDFYFCERALEAGFKVYVDFNNTLGRIMHYSVWPSRLPDGVWRPEVRSAMPWEDAK